MDSENKKRPRYWYCIIGPIPDDEIASYGDFTPRMAARNAILQSTGHDPTCSSGWIEESEALAKKKAR